MTARKIILMCLGLVIPLAYACDKFVSPYHNIEVINSAYYDIYVVPGYANGWWINSYPQTSLPSNRPNLIRVDRASTGLIQSGKPWEDIYKELSKDTLSFYFFNADTVDSKPWTTIQRNKAVLIRKDYSLVALQAAKFKLTYP